MYQLKTRRGYQLSEVVSVLQKALRRGDALLAGYFALEMQASGYDAYCWRRLLTVSAEDCAGLVTLEVEALHRTYLLLRKGKTAKEGEVLKAGRVCLSKAVILLAQAKKSRDADHLSNLVYDAERISQEILTKALAEAEPVEIPDYAFDCHTAKGKRAGKTKADFFRDEHAALSPKQAGLFDHVLEEAHAVLAPRQSGLFDHRAEEV